jgi:YVTN family beta-propeller protein
MSVRILALVLVAFSMAEAAKTQYGYVANHSDNTVSVIDTNTDLVIKTVSVGTGPWGVAVNQAGTFVYVSNNTSNNVSVISTSTNAVTATIPVGAEPYGVAFSLDGKTAYVANHGSNTVSVINTGTKTVKATITVGTNPFGTAVTPTGTFVYVTNSGSGSVSVISTLTDKVVATITGLNSPTSVVISPDGSTAYVPNKGSNTVSVIRTADNSIVNTISLSTDPYRAAVSPDGRWVYVALYGGGTGDSVALIDTSTQTIVKTVVVGTAPTDVAFSGDSSGAGVINSGSNNVSVINTGSQTVTNTIAVGMAPMGGAVQGTVHVSTVVGGFVGDKGAATSAALGGPRSTVEDSAGNLYISDVDQNRIRKVSSTGTITTYMGTGICGYNGENVASTKAMTCEPAGMTFDPSHNLILAELGNSRIRKINHTTGMVTTIAGTGVAGYSGNGGPATSAQIGGPVEVTYDSSGNLYFSDSINCVVRKIDTTGTITTYAGTGTCGYNSDGIPATTAELNSPVGLVFDGSGNLYIGDSLNHRVRMVSSGGTITTFAGTGQNGFSGDGGPATSAKVGSPRGLSIASGALYIAEAGSSRYRYVNLSTNVINTYAGSIFGYDGDGHSLTASEFALPRYMLFDSSSNPIFDDRGNGRVRKATGGIVSTIAGGFIGDGSKATSAAFGYGEALAIDKSNNLYIADETGNRVRKVSAGIIKTIAGNGVSGYSGDSGPGTSAMLNQPQGVTVDATGNVYIADTFNDVIRKVDTSGTITTFATSANFSYLLQMAVDSSNNVYVADAGTCVIWKITPAAVVSIAAGTLFTCGYSGDGLPATSAQLNSPYSVTFDGSGNMLIADWGNNVVREVNTGGVIGTIAGNGTCGWTGDGGSATAAEVCPNSVAVDASGHIYIADFIFERIRKIKSGTISTYAGAGFGFNGDGMWPLYTTFDDPVAVAVDSKGALYEVDDVDHRVRKIQ